MSEKKYRLKEDARKYFSLSMKGLVREKFHWIADGISLEALEEVEERVNIYGVQELKDGVYNYYISKSIHNNKPFSEQEREDIEKFLNVFGSMDNLFDLVHSWEHSKSDLIVHTFESWLKEKGYDK